MIPVVVALLGLLLAGGLAQAAVFEISPANTVDCNEEFESVANSLQPGDELILRGGTYSQSCRRAITVNGSATSPIVIRAADGERPVLTRPNASQNNIDIEDSSHVIIRGIAFRGGDRGVRFIRGNNITFEDNEIFDTDDNALSTNSGDSDAFIIRRNHIHDTGLGSGSTAGEGMYLGCNNAACRMTNTLIEGNYIHHLRATSGGGNDGIEIKAGSYGNIVRNNVVHDTNIGTEYPCIFVYGGGDGVNIVEGNALWNCGEAIQVAADAIIRNNLILNSSIRGITASSHAQVPDVRNVTIVNNTIFGHPTCLYVRWATANNVTLANNAIHCADTTAINSNSLAAANVLANYVNGSLTGGGIGIDDQRFFAAGDANIDFVDPAALDFWPPPGSALIGAANSDLAAELDFNETARSAPIDVGAYQSQGLADNPGWQVSEGFKTPPGFGSPPEPQNVQVR